MELEGTSTKMINYTLVREAPVLLKNSVWLLLYKTMEILLQLGSIVELGITESQSNRDQVVALNCQK